MNQLPFSIINWPGIGYGGVYNTDPHNIIRFNVTDVILWWIHFRKTELQSYMYES